MRFFTSPADLREWFLRVEAVHPLSYALMNLVSDPDRSVYPSIVAVPDLDSFARYYLLPPGEQPGRWLPSRSSGGAWHYVDRQAEENVRWPILVPSRRRAGDVLGEGSIWLERGRADHDRLRLIVEREARPI